MAAVTSYSTMTVGDGPQAVVVDVKVALNQITGYTVTNPSGMPFVVRIEVQGASAVDPVEVNVPPNAVSNNLVLVSPVAIQPGLVVGMRLAA